ncbi:MAG TPA: GIY-YIG nuclease family protein [Acidobacteriaceae bacterium]|nr:GIY-YIG nuclease family protein [Acidobacteriaceae bacterium]
MATLKDVSNSVVTFEQSFPRPGVPDLSARLTSFQFVYEQDWPRLWAEGGTLRKFAEDPCVYFFFDEEESLMYIGSARVLGNRFFQHFDAKHAVWKRRTRGLAILPLPKDSWFEIRAIEAYLIQKLDPSHNVVGRLSEIEAKEL